MRPIPDYNSPYYKIFKEHIFNSKLLCIGITGGMGSGKTYFCDQMSRYGYTVFSCDKVAKRLLANDPVILKKMRDLIGSVLISPEGMIRKDVIREFIKASAVNRQRVNEIIHPAVAREFAKLVERKAEDVSPTANSSIRYMAFMLPESLLCFKRTHSYTEFLRRMVRLSPRRVVFLESAILFEAGFDELVHTTVFLDAPSDVRADRVMRRDKVSKQEVQRWFAAQGVKTACRRNSDIVVLNHQNLPKIPKQLLY